MTHVWSIVTGKGALLETATVVCFIKQALQQNVSFFLCTICLRCYTMCSLGFD